MNQDKTQAQSVDKYQGVALVTGAARRIGAQIAKTLHHAQYDVVVHCQASIDEAEALVDELNRIRANSACVLRANLCIQKEAEALVHKAYQWKGALDVLINNASSFIKTPLERFDEHVWDTLYTIHAKAPFWLSMAARMYLKASKHGNIVNITDIHAEKPLKHYLAYIQSKAALKLQTEMLAIEFAPEICVNAVAPGAIIPPEGDNLLDTKIQNKILAEIPLNTWGTPKAVSEAVLSLITNAYITGQTLRVDGGRSTS